METPDGGTPRRGELETANTHTVIHLQPDGIDGQNQDIATAAHTNTHTGGAGRQLAAPHEQNPPMCRSKMRLPHAFTRKRDPPAGTSERH